LLLLLLLLFVFVFFFMIIYCYYSCYADCRLAQQQQCGPCPGSNPLWSAFQLLCIHLQAGGPGIALADFAGPQNQKECLLFLLELVKDQ